VTHWVSDSSASASPDRPSGGAGASPAAQQHDGLPPAPPMSNRALAVLQRIGRSLMLPIAVMPAAALLLRLGQDDLLGGWDLKAHAPVMPQHGLHLATHWHQLEYAAKVITNSGNAIYTYLPLLFAIGVAIGFARRADGSTALAAAVGYLVFNEASMITQQLNSDWVHKLVELTYWSSPTEDSIGKNPIYVLGGIVMGITTALLYQRFYRIKLPPYLAFFGGRRFVPIVSAFAGLLLGVLLGLIWPWVGTWIFDAGKWMAHHGTWGAGVYGVVNRLLLPFGLHHIVNNVAWYTIGTCHGAIGDMNCFFHGSTSAGWSMTGFFPVMMFGLPAAALAMIRAARPEKRKLVGGILLSAALCSFLTGVTEPIEFSFLFVAPALFGIHAVLTGASMALCQALGIHDGFGFSAGLIDYLINWDIATQPWLLLIIGAVYAVVYYALFTVAIRWFDIMTPGRELDPGAVLPGPRHRARASSPPSPSSGGPSSGMPAPAS
jgi:PTS system N-acetylglucosamine-specific IIC component